MKELVKLIICITILPMSSFSQWNISYNSGSFHSSAISVLNSDTALLVGGAYGRIYRTDDGGNSWHSYQTEFNSSWFFDMDFVDESIGYVAGGTFFGNHTDVLARTIDGGVTWDSITSNSGLFGYTIDQIDFVNIDTGFLAGHSGLKRTFDGGTTFTPFAHTFSSISEVYFDENNMGFVAESKVLANNYSWYCIWKTADLGNTWNLVYSDSLLNANGINHRAIARIQMVDTNTGYASGGNSTILKTMDGGNTWSRSSIAPYSTSLTGMWFTDVNTGYVNNAGGVYKTIDGGQNWVVQTVSPVSVINHIAFADSQNGFAGGQDGIYTTNNGGIQTSVSDLDESDLNLYPNPAHNTLTIDFDKNTSFSIRVMDLNGATSGSIRRRRKN